MGSPKSPKCGF